jgi:hypothetical protein
MRRNEYIETWFAGNDWRPHRPGYLLPHLALKSESGSAWGRPWRRHLSNGCLGCFLSENRGSRT